ncbi:unnamed protein product [Effrenium voratum]|nr:unnamed protein product [Effrenium voratum]
MVILNALAMLLEFELSGQSAGSHLGLSTGWPLSSTMPVFRGISATFDVVFFLELAVRVAIERRRFLKELANLFDSILVLAGLVELHFIIMTTPADQMSWRVFRALSSIRAIRVLRAFRFCQGLRLLLNACQSFVVSLCWSMVLLGVVMIAASLVIGNLLQDYIRDDNVGFDDRVWVWQYYGTAYRSWYTLYEITFAGSWPTMARPVLEKVSHGFVCFYVLYITIIVFALIRVITAVFLKDTLDAAHNDAELRMAEGLRKKAEYVEKLAGIFQAIDETGDGLITEERLTFILENPKVKAYFQTLDVDVHEGAALFHILDDGDGECTLEEFIGGILRCRGPARAIDQVAMMADLKQLDKKISKIVKALVSANLLTDSGPASRAIGANNSCEVSEGGGLPHDESTKRRRASEAAQTFLYRTSMLQKGKHGSMQMQGDDCPPVNLC